MGFYSGIMCDGCGCSEMIYRGYLMTDHEAVEVAKCKGWLADGRMLCVSCQSKQRGGAEEIKEISEGLTEENQKYVHAVATALLFAQQKS